MPQMRLRRLGNFWRSGVLFTPYFKWWGFKTRILCKIETHFFVYDFTLPKKTLADRTIDRRDRGLLV